MHEKKAGFVQVNEALAPLNFSGKTVYSAAVKDYFDYYGLNIEGAVHKFGTFQSRGFTLAAHCFVPAKYRSAVIVLHGYLDHTGLMARIIRLLFQKN